MNLSLPFPSDEPLTTMSLRARASSWPRLLLRRNHLHNPRSYFSRQIYTIDASAFPRRISVNQTPWIASQTHRFSARTMSPAEADRVVRDLLSEVEKEKQREREERQRQGLDFKDIDDEDDEDYLGIQPFIERLTKQKLKDDGELNRREESSDSDSELDEVDWDEERKKEDIFNKKFQRHKELLQTLTKSGMPFFSSNHFMALCVHASLFTLIPSKLVV